MDDISANDPSGSLSLVEIDSYRNLEERSRDGKSGKIMYFLKYYREDDEIFRPRVDGPPVANG